MSASSAEGRRARAAAEAAEWAVRLDAGYLSAAERGEFVDWLQESPVHVAEMLRIGRLTSALTTFEDWGRVAPAGDLPQDTVISLGPYRAAAQTPRRMRSGQRKWLTGIAAAVAVAMVSGALLRQQLSETAIHTQAGERRQMTLSDGSIIDLSPGTELRIRFKPHTRSVMIERGEALFRVAKDKTRPFVVAAAATRVQAVGTVFSVACNAETVIVTVSEGRVRVSPAVAAADNSRNGPKFSDISLQANEQVSVSVRGTASPIHRVESPAAPQWRDNQLIFEDTRVADVVARFNRINRVQIRITDGALAARTVSGVFSADDPQSFIDFLQAVAGTATLENGPDEIVVTPHAPGSDPAVSPRSSR